MCKQVHQHTESRLLTVTWCSVGNEGTDEHRKKQTWKYTDREVRGRFICGKVPPLKGDFALCTEKTRVPIENPRQPRVPRRDLNPGPFTAAVITTLASALQEGDGDRNSLYDKSAVMSDKKCYTDDTHTQDEKEQGARPGPKPESLRFW